MALVASSYALAPAPRPNGTPARTEKRISQGRAPSFTSSDLAHLVASELEPKPWLRPALKAVVIPHFPKTVAKAADLKADLKELKGSVKASVADLRAAAEAIPIYRSAQSIAARARGTRAEAFLRADDVDDRRALVERNGPARTSAARTEYRSGRAPGLTSQDVTVLIERELPSRR